MSLKDTFRWWHLALLSAVFLLAVYLYLAPRTKSAPAPEAVASGFDVLAYRDSVYAGLSPEVSGKLKSFEKLLEQGNNNAACADSMFTILKENRQLLLAAISKKTWAEMSGTSPAYLDAGKFAQAAASFLSKPAEMNFLNKLSITLLEKASSMDSSSNDIKIALASAYVRGSNEPMKGIGMLRQMVAADSTLVDAQLQLAMFAIQSGQTEKAISRLKLVRRMQPNNTEAMLYLAQVYADTGKKNEAIAELQEFKKNNTDALIAQQVDAYLNQLKNKNQ
ncbi:MAG: tetratricopeptide repeat protein [Bacteroidota bacterium]|jgi:predicted Zn-dependent protease